MILRTVTALVLATAPAQACPPVVQLVGEPELVAAIAEALRARGIAGERADCPVVTARVERRAGGIAIAIERAQPIEREVREVATAATVIESFAREDAAAPLLATRDVPHVELASVRPAVHADGPMAAPRHRPRGLHVFAGMESSVASDRTRWIGLHAGTCWMVGVVCLAARLRSSRQVDGGEMERNSWELQLGVDAPFVVGAWLITPGMALGPSGMSTRTLDAGESTRALRGDAHATVSIPVTRSFAVDLHVAFNLLQQLHVDERMDGELPAEPWGFMRFGLALRYGTR